ncbi:MAG: endonuclease/exonuclease/phosphatase family protein, partial [Clostridia bacterium]|nr:endonuclease/exonuclease/phosphatase family protein [Clostridia bacterium]
MAKRILMLAIVSLLIIGALVSCKDGSSDAAQFEPAQIADSETVLYKFIRSADASETVIAALQKAHTGLYDMMGVRAVINTTEIKVDNVDDQLEILIGATDRRESDEAADELMYNDWCVRVIGKKVVINAHKEENLGTAVDWFLSNLVKSDTGIRLESEYTHKAEYAYSRATLAGTPISEYVFVKPASATVFDADAVEQIRVMIGELTGYYLDVITDADTQTAHEIVVGKTSRPISVEAYMSVLTTMQGKIQVNDGNVALYTGSRTVLSEIISKMEASIKGEKQLEAGDFYTMDHTPTLRIMSSNIYFGTEGGADHTYQKRMPRLAQTYLQLKPDIIMLQEARTQHFGVLYPLIDDEYSYVNTTASDGNDMLQKVVYRKGKYTVVKSEYTRYDTGVLPFGMHVVIFERVSDGQRFAVIDTHFESDHDGDNSAERRKECQQIVDRIKALREEYPDIPVIMGGDLNSESASDVQQPLTDYEVMNETRLAAENYSDLELGTTHGKFF